MHLISSQGAQRLIQLLQSLLHQEGLILVVALVVILSLWGFIELADEVIEGETRAFDVWMLHQLRRPDDPSVPIGPACLTQAMLDITALGAVAVLTLMVLIVVGYLLLQRAYSAIWLVLVATLGGALLSAALKQFFGRERPESILHLREVFNPSFPSGHAMLSAVVYLTLGILFSRAVARPAIRMYFFSVALVLTALVGLSRIYLGMHYPTDVLAGWAVGLVWALLCWLAAHVLERISKPPYQ